MRILITQDTDWIKRYPGQQHHLAERLSLRGHEIRVIDYEILWKTEGKKELFSRRQVFNNVSKVINFQGLSVVRPGIIKIPLLDYISMVYTYSKEIDKQIREFHPDIIIGHSILTNYLSMKFAKKYRIPFIFHMTDAQHTMIPFKQIQPLGKIIEQNILKNADRVITINEKLRDYAIKMGADSSKTHVVRGGIDLERYNYQLDGTSIREKYGIKKDDFLLFFMGWLYSFSGLKEVAVELSKTRESMPNIKFLIVGSGDALEELREISLKYDLGDRLILAGSQPYEKIPEYIAASDICLLPAYCNETMSDIVPIKLYEYLAMGKPVIATSLPGVRKEFGDNGISYINKPEETIKRAIQLINDGLLKEKGMQGRKFVERNDWNKLTNDFEIFLKSI
ncbi:MAG: glycosyltransferase family 4 protein [Candidatus Methanofastidiosa archaeon]|nr:glycosyltransferase family 4 protein [Candidatus Methanofastidiosa archaeon]